MKKNIRKEIREQVYNRHGNALYITGYYGEIRKCVEDGIIINVYDSIESRVERMLLNIMPHIANSVNNS